MYLETLYNVYSSQVWGQLDFFMFLKVSYVLTNTL